MGNVILCCFFLYLFFNVTFQRIAEVIHAANFTIEPKDSLGCGFKCAKIVGGWNTKRNEYPWMVALCVGPKCSTTTQICGATLLTKKFIITTAHCIEDMHAAEFYVSLGDHNINSESETNSQVYQIERIINHERFNPTTNFNDIALLKVKGKVKLNDNVRPACLPKSKAPYSNKIAITMGWGTTSSRRTYSKILKKVKVRVLDDKICRRSYGYEFKPGMLCAGTKNKDSCEGDSGGPLVLKNKKNKWELIGVVSWGSGCGSPGYPGLYSKVRYYLKWIEARIGKNSKC